MPGGSGLITRARAELGRARGGGPVATAYAPGRCTLVGEHVDYVGGLVVCLAIDLGVAVALRRSPDGVWRARSAGRSVEASGPGRRGDIGDRIFAPAVGLAGEGIEVPAVEVGIAATLPEGAGLSSSAAVLCAVAAAMLRLAGARLPARTLATAAMRAEREVVGAPVGPLDHRAVIESPPEGVLLLDCRDGGAVPLPWPWADVRLVACDTGHGHDVAGAGYRRRRAETEGALAVLGVETCRDADAGSPAMAALGPVQLRRVRHVVGETARAAAAAAALRQGDAPTLGALMSASHASLRDDLEVSTPELDATVAAATGVAGCLGARLVGAGFGGTAVALVRREAAAECARAMARAAGTVARTWTLRPAAGLAARCPDVIG